MKLPDSDKMEWIECFKSSSNCTEELANREIREAKLGNKYRVVWIPDTIMAMCLIISQFNSWKSTGEWDKNYIFSVDDKVGRFFAEIQDFSDPQAIRTKLYSTVFENENKHKDMLSLTCNAARLIDSMLDSFGDDWNSIVIEMMKLLREVGGNLADLNVIYQHKLGNSSLEIEGILKDAYLDVLLFAVQKEVEAYENGEFLLWRAVGEFDTFKGKMNDIPGVDLSNPHKRIPVSTSYNLNILEGSLFDRGKNGARCLDYFFKKRHSGFVLSLSKANYLYELMNNLEMEEGMFFIPPLSTAVRLVSCGELFHPRSKAPTILPWGLLKGMTKRALQFVGTDDFYKLGIFFLSSKSAEQSIEASLAMIITKSSWFRIQASNQVEFIPVPKSTLSFFDDFQRDSEAVLKDMLGEVEQMPFDILDLQQSFPSSFPYSALNSFRPVFQGEGRIHINHQFGISFDDAFKRVRKHALVIPRVGYVNWIEFAIKSHDQEMKGFIGLIAKTIRLLRFPNGYRLVCNVSLQPGDQVDPSSHSACDDDEIESFYQRGQMYGNNAHQQVSHLHVHIGGGECLEFVAPEFENDDERNIAIISGISLSSPSLFTRIFSHAFNEDILVEAVYLHESWAHPRDNYGNALALGAVRIMKKTRGKMEYAFKNFLEFADHSSVALMRLVFNAVVDAAKLMGIYESGFRIFCNNGMDAWQLDGVGFVFFVAGGISLNPTLSSFCDDRDYEERKRKFLYSRKSGLLEAPVLMIDELILMNNYRKIAKQFNKQLEEAEDNYIMMLASELEAIEMTKYCGFLLADLSEKAKFINSFHLTYRKCLESTPFQCNFLSKIFKKNAEKDRWMLSYLSKLLKEFARAHWISIERAKLQGTDIESISSVIEESAYANERLSPLSLGTFAFIDEAALSLKPTSYWKMYFRNVWHLSFSTGGPSHSICLNRDSIGCNLPFDQTPLMLSKRNVMEAFGGRSFPECFSKLVKELIENRPAPEKRIYPFYMLLITTPSSWKANAEAMRKAVMARRDLLIKVLLIQESK